VVEPGAGGVRFGEAFVAAVSRAGAAYAADAAAGCGEGAEFLKNSRMVQAVGLKPARCFPNEAPA
jgi:hypothetical protein